MASAAVGSVIEVKAAATVVFTFLGRAARCPISSLRSAPL